MVVCGYPELYIHLRTFTKTGIEAPPMTRIRVCCVVNFTRKFVVRMKQISCTNEASKLKMFKRPTSREWHDLFTSFTSGVNAHLEGQIKIFEQTLNFADFRPLFLLNEHSLQFGAKGHMIEVIQHDADHASREMLEPRDRDDLTEL